MDVILAGNSYVKNWGKGTHSGAANKRYQPPARSTRTKLSGHEKGGDLGEDARAAAT